MPVFVKSTLLPGREPQEVFDWHNRPGAFERLVPPWEDVRLVRAPERLSKNAEAVLDVPAGPMRMRWIARIEECDEGNSFLDVQIEGPFARWEHLHRFDRKGTGTLLRDEVRFSLPVGALAGAVAGGFVERKLKRLFSYRHRITERDLETHRLAGEKTMKIAVTGSTGLIGSALVPFLTSGGHSITRIVRKRRGSDDQSVLWQPAKGFPEGTEKLEGMDAVIHLAGENIAGGRWTEERKQRIRDSRVDGTRTLCEALANLNAKPKVLVSSSATGYYGETGSTAVDETSEAGRGFLEETSRAWEEATAPAREAGIRVVRLRTGIVLSPKGGLLEKVLPFFKFGLGGRLGNGRQYMSWISIEDMIGAIHHAMITEDLEGPVNAVAPNAVTNAEFTKVLARVLRRPAGPPVPALALRVMYGEMAEELMLKSTRAVPARLLDSGYEFRHEQLEDALREVLGMESR